MLTAALLIPIAGWAEQRGAPVKPAVETARPAPPPAQADDPATDDDLDLGDLVSLGFGDEITELVDHGDGDGGDDERIVDRRVHRIVGPHRGMGRGMGGGMFGPRGAGMRGNLAGLDLTDDQRTKLQALHETQARKAVQRRADMQLARLDLHKLMREDRPNMAGVNSQIDKLARLHAESMKARFETHMQARALLTPEQVKKLRQGMPGMHHEMGDFEGWR
jgi:Spy/CpxP family protein refolding chaperone